MIVGNISFCPVKPIPAIASVWITLDKTLTSQVQQAEPNCLVTAASCADYLAELETSSWIGAQECQGQDGSAAVVHHAWRSWVVPWGYWRRLRWRDRQHLSHHVRQSAHRLIPLIVQS